MVKLEGVANGKDRFASLEGGGVIFGEGWGELESLEGGGKTRDLEFEDNKVFFGFVAHDGSIKGVKDSLEFDLDAGSRQGRLDEGGNGLMIGNDRQQRVPVWDAFSH